MYNLSMLKLKHLRIYRYEFIIIFNSELLLILHKNVIQVTVSLNLM